MPISFHIESLKAQSVASYTYFSRERNLARENPKEDLNGADFFVDTSNWMYYTTMENLKARWGNKFDEYFLKIKEAVDSVFGEILKTEDGKPILAMYHAISNGNTENSSDIFGDNVSYLSAVASPGDQFAPDFQTFLEISFEDFKNKIILKYPDIKFSENISSWIGEKETTISGTVKNINICGKNLTGREIRNIFSLRSATFEIIKKDNTFMFKIKGYGHGVGMSQYGAEYMARQGSTYKEILNWYYKI